jgi:hypothetical protein
MVACSQIVPSSSELISRYGNKLPRGIMIGAILLEKENDK